MIRFFSFLFLLLIVPCLGGFAQTPPGSYEITSLTFDGNDEISDDDLLDQMETRESPGWLSQFMYRNITEKIGGAPLYFNAAMFASDIIRIKQFYQENGFFHSRIDTLLQFDPSEPTIDITIVIAEGQRSYVDTVLYRGFNALPSIVTEELDESRRIEVGDPYRVTRIEEELARISTIFANNGYRDVKINQVRVTRYASTNNVTVEFSVVPGSRFRVGTIEVQQDASPDRQVQESIVRDHLEFVQGDFYSEAARFESERNLNRLGTFEATRIEPVREAVNDTSMEIPFRVTVRPRPFQELSPEIGASDKNNAFNVFFGLGYNHRNFLGGARNFSARTRANVQSILDINVSRILKETGARDSSLVADLEAVAQIVQPYLFSNDVSLSMSLGYVFEKQRTYLADIVRWRLGATAQLARFTRGIVEWNLERVLPEELTPGGTKVIEPRPDLQKQFNSIIVLTLQRDRRDDLFSPTEGFFHSVSVEEAGLIPSLSGSLFRSRLPYSQYYKLSAVGQWYWRPSEVTNFVWATRVMGGFAQLYGASSSPVPLTRKFYAGGSGSVRAWKSRSLGAVPDPNLGGNAQFEANLEGRWHVFDPGEKFFFIDLSNISLVMFTDVGNVWPGYKNFRFTELAIASGFGFRWDTIAGPIRIDVAVRVYDPFAADRKWVTQRKLFKDSYSLVQFGIGHAF